MTTYSGVLGDDRCECEDCGCPVNHGHKQCSRKATTTLWRVDMEDETGTRFCDDCASDAWDAGVFTDTVDDDSE